MSKIQIEPKVYPRCARCKTPYVLRLGVSVFGGTEQWAWFRDCRHKARPETVDNRPKPAKRAPRPLALARSS